MSKKAALAADLRACAERCREVRDGKQPSGDMGTWETTQASRQRDMRLCEAEMLLRFMAIMLDDAPTPPAGDLYRREGRAFVKVTP